MGNSSSSHLAEVSEEKRLLVQSKYESSKIAELLKELESTFSGQIIVPSDSEKYNEARNRPWNFDQRGFPIVICRPNNTLDISVLIQFYNQHLQNLSLCIASGCHSSQCMVDDSVVIDLFNLKEIAVDKENLTATVGTGCYMKMIDEALAPLNFGMTTGSFPHTGIGGVALSGGYGFLARKYGLTCDHILEVELVLSDGRVIVANATNEYSDILWCVKGGGGNFGVATKITFKVHQLPSSCIGGAVVYLAPLVSTVQEIAMNFDTLYQNMPDEVSGSMILIGGGSVVPTAWSYIGDITDPKQVPALVQAGQLGGWLTFANKIRPMSYHHELQSMFASHHSSGFVLQSIVQFGDYSAPLPKSFWESFLGHIRSPLPHQLLKAAVLVMTMGGAIVKDTDNSCVSAATRKSRYFGIIEVHWNPDSALEGKQAAIDWTSQVYSIISPFRVGDLKYSPDEVKQTFLLNTVDDSIEKKLSALKHKFDPQNIFRQNFNIH